MAEDNKSYDEETADENETSGLKVWVEENLRLIVSVIIVLAIAGGIYSYSQRGQEDRMVLEDDSAQEQILLEGEEAAEDIDETSDDSEAPTEEVAMEEGVSSAQTDETEEVSTPEPEAQAPTQDTSVPTQETTESYIVSAQRGDGLTHMARRAVADYLAQNPSSSLTPAHKIYIEDYVRKAVDHHGSVQPDTQVSFSKDIIGQAVDASLNLTDSQLDNLQKYVVLAPSLS